MRRWLARFVLNNINSLSDEIAGLLDGIVEGSPTAIVVAASNAPEFIRDGADYVCDGTADEEEIQAAIDSLTSGRTVKETVQLVGGTFILSDTVTIPSYTRLIIDATITCTDDFGESAAKPLFKNSDQTNGNVHIEITGSGCIDGNNNTFTLTTDTDNSGSWQVGDIVKDNAGGTTWVGTIQAISGTAVRIHLTSGEWFDIKPADGIQNTTRGETDTISNGCLSFAACDLININTGAFIEIHNLHLRGAKQNAIYMKYVVFSKIRNNSIHRCGKNGIETYICGVISQEKREGLGFGVVDTGSQAILIEGNLVRLCGEVGIRERSSHDTVILGNEVEHTGIAHIRVTSPIGTVITGNRVEYFSDNIQDLLGITYASEEGLISIKMEDDATDGTLYTMVNVCGNVGGGETFFYMDCTGLTRQAGANVVGNVVETGILAKIYSYQPTCRLSIRDNMVGRTDASWVYLCQIEADSIVDGSLIAIVGNHFSWGGHSIRLVNINNALVADNICDGVDDSSIYIKGGTGIRIERNQLVQGITEGNFVEIANSGSYEARDNMCYVNRTASKTSDYSIEKVENGTSYNNTGATATVTLTLPSAEPGLEFIFTRTASHPLRIVPQPADRIVGMTAGDGAAGEYFEADADNESVWIKCLISGEWQVIQEVGTWAQQTP